MPQLSEVVGHIFGFGLDIMTTALDAVTNVILAQVGDSTAQTSDSDRAEWWQHTGFASRPAVPSAGKPACQGIVVRHSKRDHVIATRDVRGSAIYGNLADGETCVYSSASRAASVWKADGSVSHTTTDDNTATGNLVMRRLTPTQESFWSPWGSQLHDTTGWHLRTWHGVKIDAGGLGLPAPFSSLGLKSSLLISADQINVDAAMLTLGRNTGHTGAVVQALPLQLILASLATTLTAIGTVLGTGSNSGGPVVFAGLNTFTSAVSATNLLLATVSVPAATGGAATLTAVA